MYCALGEHVELRTLEYTELPRDPVDARYVLSYSPNDKDNIKGFFEEYGFVVISCLYFILNVRNLYEFHILHLFLF